MPRTIKETREELVYFQSYFNRSAIKADKESADPNAEDTSNYNKGKAAAFRVAAGEIESVIEWIDAK